VQDSQLNHTLIAIQDIKSILGCDVTMATHVYRAYGSGDRLKQVLSDINGIKGVLDCSTECAIEVLRAVRHVRGLE
jgi:hypothetical protein